MDVKIFHIRILTVHFLALVLKIYRTSRRRTRGNGRNGGWKFRWNNNDTDKELKEKMGKDFCIVQVLNYPRKLNLENICGGFNPLSANPTK